LIDPIKAKVRAPAGDGSRALVANANTEMEDHGRGLQSAARPQRVYVAFRLEWRPEGGLPEPNTAFQKAIDVRGWSEAAQVLNEECVG